MACYRPITAYRTESVNPETGKRGITFSRSSGFIDKELKLPCGKCIGCKAKKTNEWALRCTHEAQFHDENCFITLTYGDELLPEGYKLEDGLEHRHFQLFIKRLRKKFNDRKIKYFMCGEYGGLKGRPHFHAILFGVTFKDKQFFNKTGKVTNFISDTLGALWPHGHHTIGSVHYGTARYTAKYANKQLAEDGGDYGDRRPEYRKMSQGIGASYAQKYRKDIEIHDNIVLNGHKNPVPSYYEKYLCPEALARIKDNRIKLMWKKRLKFNKTSWQLRAAEKVAEKKAKLYEKPKPNDGLRPIRI